MNQAELINKISSNATNEGISKTTIKWVLDQQGLAAQDELANGGEVTLIGIGKLTVKQSAARKGRNPATGAEMQIAAKKAPKFSAAKALKDAVA
ncbi:MAG TPA: HU family DNA-binding protein [Gallionellaceae bacterium]|nr:HU family DNA-binding protein [Gallionellaceae bacterium]